VIDALSRPQTVLLLGATSDLGQAICLRWADSLVRLVLAGRPSERRDQLVAQWQERGVETVAIDFDAADTAGHETLIREVFSHGDVDVVLLAFGVLGNQAAFEADPSAAAAAATTNFSGAVSSALSAAALLEAQGHGSLVVLSSVSGLRARRSNYVYGSTKAGLDVLANGLADRLTGTGCHVLIVRPGFVRTSMTRGLPDVPLAVDPDDVAAAVMTALAKRKRLVYVPAAMRPVMMALRALPGPVYRRLPI
jgi:decaprenylphospho-beta-D-erythro-pentofuranosid-2-ulose 2-reductase